MLADLLSDPDPLLRTGLHLLRLKDGFLHRQVFREPGAAWRTFQRGSPGPFRGNWFRRGGSRDRNLLQSRQKKLHLRRIEVLATAAEDPAGERVELLPEQFDFQMRESQLLCQPDFVPAYHFPASLSQRGRTRQVFAMPPRILTPAHTTDAAGLPAGPLPRPAAPAPPA